MALLLVKVWRKCVPWIKILFLAKVATVLTECNHCPGVIFIYLRQKCLYLLILTLLYQNIEQNKYFKKLTISPPCLDVTARRNDNWLHHSQSNAESFRSGFIFIIDIYLLLLHGYIILIHVHIAVWIQFIDKLW